MPILMSIQGRQPHWSSRAVRLALPLGMSLALGCQGDHLSPAPLADPAELFWSLDIDHRAVTLSTTPPYDTLTITATPKNFAGEALVGVSSVPQFTSSDSSKVHVTPEGVLVAVAPTSGIVMVTVRQTVNEVTHTDSVYVRAVNNATPPVLGNLSIHPIPPDSAKRAVYSLTATATFFLSESVNYPLTSLRITDVAGQALPEGNWVVNIRSSDPTVVSLYAPGTAFSQAITSLTGSSGIPIIQAKRPGSATLYASTTVFGVTKVDTLLYQIGWPLGQEIFLDTASSRGPGYTFFNLRGEPITEVTIGAGGFVFWDTDAFILGAPNLFEADIVFDDPTHVLPYDSAAAFANPDFYAFCDDPNFFIDGCSTGGNFVLPMGEPLGAAFRVFPVPGVYPFHNAQNGAQGRIVVK